MGVLLRGGESVAVSEGEGEDVVVFEAVLDWLPLVEDELLALALSEGLPLVEDDALIVLLVDGDTVLLLV